MKTRPLIAAAVAGIAVSALTATTFLATPAMADDDRARGDDVRQLRESGKVLPMEDILARSRAAQPGQVVEVELERENGGYIYEVKIIDDADKVHKLEIDAASGEVLQRKSK